VNRRTVLGCVGTTVSLSVAGCFGSDNSPEEREDSPEEREDSPEEREDSPEERGFPEKPDPLTKESVKAFVTEHEEVWIHNHQLTEDTTEISVGCANTAVVMEREGGYYVTTMCSSTVHLEEGAVGGGVPSRRFYFVSDDATRRIDYDHSIDESKRTYRNSSSSSEHIGFRLVNFDETTHEVSVTVTHRKENETILDRTYEPVSASFFTLSGLTAVEGIYDVTVELNEEESAAYEWQIENIGPQYGMDIYISPSGTFHVGDITP
jgi:hypothetical protein